MALESLKATKPFIDYLNRAELYRKAPPVAGATTASGPMKGSSVEMTGEIYGSPLPQQERGSKSNGPAREQAQELGRARGAIAWRSYRLSKITSGY